MNTTQINEPGLLLSQEQANPITPIIPINGNKQISVNDSLSKVKNCPLTKFLSELNKKE